MSIYADSETNGEPQLFLIAHHDCFNLRKYILTMRDLTASSVLDSFRSVKLISLRLTKNQCIYMVNVFN